MTQMPDILWLEEIRKEDIASVGGKGASLGEMFAIGLPVPRAFVVTSHAFRRFLQKTGLEDTLFSGMDTLDVEDAAALEKAAQKAKSAVLKAKMPKDIQKEIRDAYYKMDPGNLVVAVRSSATAEDLPDASFAGQQDTFLNIRGEEDLLDAVQKCWASLYGGRAIYYRARQGFDNRSVNIAVVIQQLVQSEKAGVMFTSHPVTGEPLTIIEGSWGLGEAVVSGSVSPDKYVCDQRTEKVIDRLVSQKTTMIISDGEKGTKTVPVPKAKQEEMLLSDEEVSRLATFGKIAEDHYGIPQDVEWGIVGPEIYILQSRPITTIKSGEPTGAAGAEGSTGKILLQGQGAAPGIASGKVVIVNDVKDTGKIKEGDILVTRMTNPDMVPAMRKVAAIVTDEGGMTCHAAIVSRELGTPAVVGTKKATAILKPGQIITVDGEKGLIYEGAMTPKTAQPTPAQVAVAAPKIITATSVKVNVSMPEAAARAAATGADGVGLLRIEHLILGLNKTPGWFIANNKEEDFVQELYPGDQDRARRILWQAGLGPHSRCPHRRVPEHGRRGGRTDRAQPDARLARYPPRPAEPRPVQTPGGGVQTAVGPGVRQPRGDVSHGLPPGRVHPGQRDDVRVGRGRGVRDPGRHDRDPGQRCHDRGLRQGRDQVRILRDQRPGSVHPGHRP